MRKDDLSLFMRSKMLPAVSRWQNNLVCSSISLPHDWVKSCVRNNNAEPQSWKSSHVLCSHHTGSAFWIKNRTLASPLNAVARLVIAYKTSFIQNLLAAGIWGPWWATAAAVVWRLAILLWQWRVPLMNIRVAPLLRRRQEQAWLDVLAPLLTFWQAGH